MFREHTEFIVAHLDLPTPPVRLAGPQSRKTGQSRARQSDQEEDSDHHQLGNGRESAPDRLQTMEQQVYGRAGQRYQRAEPQPPHGRDHQDAQQKDHPEDASAGDSHQ